MCSVRERKGARSRREKRGAAEGRKSAETRGGCRGFRGWQHAERSRKQPRISRGERRLLPDKTGFHSFSLQPRTPVSSSNQKNTGPTCLCRSPRERRATSSMHLHPCASSLLVSSSLSSPLRLLVPCVPTRAARSCLACHPRVFSDTTDRIARSDVSKPASNFRACLPNV